MRLLFFAQAFLPIVGGAEIFLDQLARRLCARGHSVTVVAARKRGAPGRLDAPYRLLRYRKPFYRHLWPRYGIVPLLRAHAIETPDCVHAHGAYPPGYAVASYAKLVHRPWVVRPIGFDILPDEALRTNPKLEVRVRESLLAATRVVAQSIELVELIAAAGVARERIVRIPNGVELGEFAPRRFERASAPTIAAMGVFHRKKGFDVLLDAFAELAQRAADARLLLAGDGEERAALEARVHRDPRLRGRVEFPGVVRGEAKLALLQRAWLFVSASRREPFSNANLEALAAGAPMVVTAVGGNREIVGEDENGFLVAPDDARALATAIERLLGDRERRERFARASLERAREYAWDGVVERYENLYRSLAEGAPSR